MASCNLVKSLNDLPNEILLHIFHSIDAHRTERVLGHISVDALLDDPDAFADPDRHRAKDFLEHSNALSNLALVNRKFSLLVPEALYYSLHLSTNLPPTSADGGTRARIAYLLRTLYERPKLTSHVRELCVYINNETCKSTNTQHQAQIGQPDWCCNLSGVEPVHIKSLTECARGLIKAQQLLPEILHRWDKLIVEDLRSTILGALVVLLPQLGALSIVNLATRPLGGVIGSKHDLCAWYDLWKFRRGHHEASLDSAPITISPRYLKLSRLFPSPYFGVQHFSNLQFLDVSNNLSGSNQNLIRDLLAMAKSRSGTGLDCVRNLRVDCQTSTVGIWRQQAQVCLIDLVQAFHCLKSLDFYAEPSHEKNPFRSVRAFPHYQRNIQIYPDNVADDGSETSNQTWDQRLYDARTEFTDYQHLIDIIHHMRPNLETLRLPGGFWTLPGGARKTLPRFAQFARLGKLSIPQVAIISLKLDNMVPLDENKGDFVLSPLEALPPQIEHLTVFDADLSFLKSIWLITLFVEHSSHRSWPSFQKLTILFGLSCTDEDLDVLKTRATFAPFWTLVDKTGLDITLGRDDNIPMLDY